MWQNFRKKHFFYFSSKSASKKQECDWSTKKGKNRPKIAYRPKWSPNVKQSKSFIKNPFRYVFYKFDQIFEKKFFFHFSPKLAPKKQECQKTSKIRFFLTSEGSSDRQKFLDGKKISQKSAKMYIFKLIKYWRPVLNI